MLKFFRFDRLEVLVIFVENRAFSPIKFVENLMQNFG